MTSIEWNNHYQVASISSPADSCSPFVVLYSDRFLPDKAIDLIDEAGSRVRLRHAQVRNNRLRGEGWGLGAGAESRM